MAREKRSRDDVKDIKNTVVEERKKETDAIPPMVRDTGGSIGALDGNKSLYFKKWLVNLQERKNPLIGKKYITAAEEYNTESKLIGEASVENLSDAMKNTLDKGAEKYNKDSSNIPDDDNTGSLNEDDNTGSLKNSVDESERNFIDITIVENLTKELQGQIDEDIEKESRARLKEYHQNNNYEPEIDIPSVIENFKFVLISQDSANLKLLE